MTTAQLRDTRAHRPAPRPHPGLYYNAPERVTIEVAAVTLFRARGQADEGSNRVRVSVARVRWLEDRETEIRVDARLAELRSR